MFDGFAVLIGLLLRITVFGVGVWLLFTGIGRRARRRTIVGAAFCLFVIYWAYSIPDYGSVQEWNPYVAPDEIAGEWYKGDFHLTLFSDGYYEFEGSAEDAKQYNIQEKEGTWLLQGWAIRMHPKGPWRHGAMAEMRVVIADSAFRIIKAFEDPDLWDGDLGFERTPTARAHSDNYLNLGN